jgi:hypothetical protein
MLSRTPNTGTTISARPLDWMRPDGSDAITGFMTQLTLTGGFANKTLFDQAGVANSRRKGDLGRMGWTPAQQGRQQPESARRLRDRPLGPSHLRPERLLWRELHRRRRHRLRRWMTGAKDFGAQACPVGGRRQDAEGNLGRRRRLDLSRRRLTISSMRRLAVLLFGQLAGLEPLVQDRRQFRLGGDRFSPAARRAAPA